MKETKKTFFSNKNSNIFLPDLISIQKESYSRFLNQGLKELLKEFSPVKDLIGDAFELYFVSLSVDEPRFDEITTKNKNLTYEAPLTVKVRLLNKKTGKKITQKVHFGDMPLMTDQGTFIINGIERVVVQQLVRSPGVFFSSKLIKGRFFYGAKIIPDRGAWLEFETDFRNVLWARIDRQRKTSVTALLRVFGIKTDKEIIDIFKKLAKRDKLEESLVLDYIKAAMEKDPSTTEEEGLIEVYRKIRPGDMATVDNARSLIYAMFFNHNRYDMSKVGRFKMNSRLEIDTKIKERTIRQEDLIEIIFEIIKFNITQMPSDDIDHLFNRRIRAVGELVQNRMRVGMLRLQRIIKDRMSSITESKKIIPGQLINIRPVSGIIREFFMSSQLSQFMDQVNVLSELEHKRRLTVVGPGGLNKDRAGAEVRDVHKTYYGKICPIQTPEGPSVGLVGQLTCYARVNEYGFIESPYRKVKNGKLTEEIVYLNAYEEEKYILAPFFTKIDKNGKIQIKQVEARVYGRPTFANYKDVEFIDIAPNQIISVGTSLIPFLEHDDGVRALMGTNMQRQAVPLFKPESPVIGTGIEGKIASDSGYLIESEAKGKVKKVSGDYIEVVYAGNKTKKYHLNKYRRSNFDTCFDQHPVAFKNQKLDKGDILAEGSSIEDGKLALGSNFLVAFMSWEGSNYEDAICISSRLMKNDKLTSLHIAQHVIDIRETKFGPEVTTRDIPNVSEEKLANLDQEGIIRQGAEVKPGDILIGKITPRGETELSAEEKLLRAIFGEKAQDVRDSSLYLKHGESGKVINIKIFSRENGDKLGPGIVKSIQILVLSLRKIQVGDKLAGRHGNKGVVSRIVSEEDMPYLLENGQPVDIILNPLGIVSRMNLGQVLETHLGLAANKLGKKIITPALNGLTEDEIGKKLNEAGYSKTGKMKLCDGRTGKLFQNPVTVGIAYMLKLNHLVENKIHQRSIGPYSLITQQPLGGKAQFGGQRFGEMEVWALEGYGASYNLQEMLTVKSDDVTGRTKAYESIINGKPVTEINIPESFSVLVRELKGLGLNVEMFRNKRNINFGYSKKINK
ncbi:DNA-directed RNA polymerase subunit beta [Patescibacteria group bacterium]|nr:DNA-directed RNA polymerase subunit beta [Patescibacteria group bacterium]